MAKKSKFCRFQPKIRLFTWFCCSKKAKWKFCRIEPLCVSLHNHKTETYCCTEFGALPDTCNFSRSKKENTSQRKNHEKIVKKIGEKFKREKTSKLRSQARGKQLCWLLEQKSDLFSTFDWKKRIRWIIASRLFSVCLKSQKNKWKRKKNDFF